MTISAEKMGRENRIGDNVTIAGVTIGDYNEIGDNVYIEPGLVIGNGNYFCSNLRITADTMMLDVREGSDSFGMYVCLLSIQAEDMLSKGETKGIHDILIMRMKSHKQLPEKIKTPPPEGSLLLHTNRECNQPN